LVTVFSAFSSQVQDCREECRPDLLPLQVNRDGNEHHLLIPLRQETYLSLTAMPQLSKGCKR